MSFNDANVVGVAGAAVVKWLADGVEVSVQKPSMSLVSSVVRSAMVGGVDADVDAGRDAITAADDERYTIDWPNCRWIFSVVRRSKIR